MGVEKRIICLANSRKLSGRCVAGVEIVDGNPAGWIRPVSVRSGKEIAPWERQYKNGDDPEIMDMMEIRFVRPTPSQHQKENWLLDRKYRWKKVGRATVKQVERLASPCAPLWVNGFKTSHGKNDRIPCYHIAGLNDSLRFIRVGAVELRVSEEFEKRKIRARFCYDGVEYILSVTDPKYDGKSIGKYNLGMCYMTVSLTDQPFEGSIYKLVAAIIERW